VAVRQHFAFDVDGFAAVYRAAKARGVLESETFCDRMYELPDGAVQSTCATPRAT
jgi:hypothetical protein